MSSFHFTFYFEKDSHLFAQAGCKLLINWDYLDATRPSSKKFPNIMKVTFYAVCLYINFDITQAWPVLQMFCCPLLQLGSKYDFIENQAPYYIHSVSVSHSQPCFLMTTGWGVKGSFNLCVHEIPMFLIQFSDLKKVTYFDVSLTLCLVSW